MYLKKTTSQLLFYLIIIKVKSNTIILSNNLELVKIDMNELISININDLDLNKIIIKYNQFKKQLGKIDGNLLLCIETMVVKNNTQKFIDCLIPYLKKKELSLKQKKDRLDQLIRHIKEDLQARLWLKNNPLATKEIIEKHAEQIKIELKSDTIDKLFQSEESNSNSIIYKKYDSTSIFAIYKKMAQYVAKNSYTFDKYKLSKLLENDFNILKKQKHPALLPESNLMHIHNRLIYHETIKIVKNVYLYRKISLDNKKKLKEKFDELSSKYKKFKNTKNPIGNLTKLNTNIKDIFSKLNIKSFEKPTKYLSLLSKIYNSKFIKDSHIELLELKTNQLYDIFFNSELDFFDSQIKDLEKNIKKFENLLQKHKEEDLKSNSKEKRQQTQYRNNKIQQNIITQNISNQTKIKKIQEEEILKRKEIFEIEQINKDFFMKEFINLKKTLKKTLKKNIFQNTINSISEKLQSQDDLQRKNAATTNDYGKKSILNNQKQDEKINSPIINTSNFDNSILSKLTQEKNKKDNDFLASKKLFSQFIGKNEVNKNSENETIFNVFADPKIKTIESLSKQETQKRKKTIEKEEIVNDFILKKRNFLIEYPLQKYTTNHHKTYVLNEKKMNSISIKNILLISIIFFSLSAYSLYKWL